MILHPSFDTNEKGHLTVCGYDAVDLAKEHGTPAYILDTDAVRGMCRMYKRAFREHFGEDSFPVYAGKALCYKNLYRIITQEGMFADCVSSGELYTASKAGFPMENVFFHGNNKTDYDLQYALALGVGYIVVDSVDELNALEAVCRETSMDADILIRVTPGIDPHTHKKIITGSVDSKFGSAIETGQAMEITELALSKERIHLKGFHCHVGSQIFDIEPFADACSIMLGFIKTVRGRTGFEAAMLNIGGGFGVRYTDKDPEIDYEANIAALGKRISALCLELGVKKPALFMEPGRSIVAAAGATLYTCGSVKEIPGFRNYVSVDGGMPDNPRYALYQAEYTAVNASKAKDPAEYECTLGGRCCESGDLLAEGIKIAKPERGDIIAVLVTGAYNFSMASNYNRIPRPPVIEVSKEKVFCSVRRQTFTDITALDI